MAENERPAELLDERGRRLLNLALGLAVVALGFVVAADLWRVAQAPLGTALRFLRVDYAAALAAEAELDAYREACRMWVELWRARDTRRSQT